MRKTISLSLVSLALAFSANAQISGIKTINPAGAGADNYVGFKAAVDSLRKYGVGDGGVTFNVAAGTYAERIVIDSVVTAGASEAKQIIFQKDPNASTTPIFRGSAVGGVEFVRIANAKWVTIDGINFQATGDGTASANTIAAIRFTAINHCTFKNLTVRGTGLYNARGIVSGDFNATDPVLKGKSPSRYVTLDNVRLVNIAHRAIQFFADYPGADGTDLNQLQQANRDRYNKVINCTLDSTGLATGSLGTAASSHGMLLLGQDSMTVANNRVTNISHSPTTAPASSPFYAILLRANLNQGYSVGNVIENNIVENGFGLKEIYGFGIWRSTNNEVRNNEVRNIEALSALGMINISNNAGLHVHNNKIDNLAGLSDDAVGILVGNDSLNSVYEYNTVKNIRSDATTAFDAIGIETQNALDVHVRNNIVENIYGSELSENVTAIGIRTAASPVTSGRPQGGSVYAYNNFVSKVYQAVATADPVQGTTAAYGMRSIRFTSGTGGKQHIYHNTILLNRPSGESTDVTYSTRGTFFYGGNSATDTVFVANNLIINANTHADDADTSFVGSFAGDAHLWSKGNNYIGANGTNVFAFVDTNFVYPNLADWIAGGTEVGADSAAVVFVDEAAGDLHLTEANYTNLRLRKSRLAWVTKDIDGTDRASGNTQVGADAQNGEQTLVSIKGNLAKAKALSVYPNPTRETARFAMNVEKSTSAQIVVRNLMGQAVATKNVTLNAGANEAGINVADLSAGIYVYSVTVDGKVSTGKFIKE